jgi:hypothetical protein
VADVPSELSLTLLQDKKAKLALLKEHPRSRSPLPEGEKRSSFHTEQVSLEVKLQACILMVIGSHLGWGTGCPL